MSDINIGDEVKVTTEVSNFTAIVKHMPCATGDSWVFEQTDGTIRCVQNFIEIIKYKKVLNNDGTIPF